MRFMFDADFKTRFVSGNFYDEFVKKIMWNEVSAPLPVTGDEVIDISYGVMKTNNSSQPQNNNSMITYNPKDLTTFKNEFLKISYESLRSLTYTF